MLDGWERVATPLAIAVIVLLRVIERAGKARRDRKAFITRALRAGMTLEQAQWHWMKAGR